MDVAGLREALSRIPATSWSLPSHFSANGVHHGYRRVVLVNAGYTLPAAEPFQAVLDEFDPIREAWLSWIDPGGFILPHRDSAPWYERWQVPIATAGDMNGQPATDGTPFQVKHHIPHHVANGTERPRVHLVIDRDVPLELPPQPFEVFHEAIPDTLAELIARTKENAHG